MLQNRWIKRILITTLILIGACAAGLAIMAASLGTSLTAHDFPLSEKWAANLGGDIQQLALVDNRIVLVRTMTEIAALDLQSGNILWQQRLDWHYSNQPPLAVDGKIFLSDGKGVLALNQSDGALLWEQTLRHPSGAEVVDVAPDLVAVNDPPYLGVYQTADGALRWENVVCREPVQAYFFEADIVVPCYSLAVMDALSGAAVWKTQAEDGIDRIWKSDFKDGVIYFSQDLENITAYDLKNQNQEWITPITEDYAAYQAYQVAEDYLFVTIDDELCVLQQEDGRKVWCTGRLIKPRNPTAYAGVLYLFNGLQKGITAYDLQDGSQIGRLDFPAYLFISVENDRQLMVASEESLIFATRGTIYAYGK